MKVQDPRVNGGPAKTATTPIVEPRCDNSVLDGINRLTVGDAARVYALHDIPVFPCSPQTKAPLISARLGGRGFKDATTDLAQVGQWWDQWPDALIGMPVPDDVAVLDVDPRHGGNLDSLGGLPDTLRVWSGRGDGGVHLYFRRPPGRLTDRNLPGIDLRDAGKAYLIVPPSAHPATGRPYVWDGGPIALMSAAILAQVVAPTITRRVAALGSNHGEHLARFVAGLTEGNRNSGLYWAACRAVENNNLDQLEPQLVQAARCIGLPDHEIRAVLSSARHQSGGAA